MTIRLYPLIKPISLVLAASLMACGGGGGSPSPSPNPTPSATPTPEPTPTPAPTPTPSPTPATITKSTSWSLVWSDEFDGPEIDPAKWAFETNCWGGGNNEQQCYTDRADNAFISDGILNIVARREDFTGNNGSDGVSGAVVTLPYTSARLRTKDLQEWTFGRFEIRARMPEGQGTWPAIWMLPTDSPYGGWASSGEIDILETVNLKVDGEAKIHATLHYGRAWPGNVRSGAEFTLPNDANPADDFHIYAVEWEEGEIRWYVDDIHYATQTHDGWYSQYEENGSLVNAPAGAPFDSEQAFHLLLNFAVGGDWPANVNRGGIDENVFPQSFLIDWVRVYECSESPSTGTGCAAIDPSIEVTTGNDAPSIGPGSSVIAQPPEYVLFEDAVSEGLGIESYNPDGVISWSTEEESGRGNVFTIAKTGALGNVFFVPSESLDMSAWLTNGELAFDMKLNSRDAGSELLIKMDSGWPDVSDALVGLGDVGVWQSYSIGVADLIDNGNSIQAGEASISSITNLLVFEPSGAMNISFDNIRFTEN